MGAGLTYNFFEENNSVGKVKESKLGYKLKIRRFKRIKNKKNY